MAVYTEVADEELEAFIASYDIGALTSCKGIAEGVENSNYLIQTEAGRYILTLYEKRVARKDLPYFLALMEHLAARGISCPLPVHDRKGQTLRELAKRPAALITFLDGVSVRRASIEQCASVGRALGRFHVAGESFPQSRANSLSLSGWAPLVVRRPALPHLFSVYIFLRRPCASRGPIVLYQRKVCSRCGRL